MKYLLLIYGDENLLNEVEREECYMESSQVAFDLHDKGQFLGTAPLQPTTTARTIRVTDGKRLVTDGPFAETREQLGGYFLIDVESMDEALDIASRLPGAHNGCVEVRPVVELEGLPGG